MPLANGRASLSREKDGDSSRDLDTRKGTAVPLKYSCLDPDEAYRIVATGYDRGKYGAFARPLQFLRLHLFEPSCANVTCPSAMQDGAARLLQIHLETPELASKLSRAQMLVFKDAFERLTSRDPDVAWTSGQWMTERSGGSDVSQTETVATHKVSRDLSPASNAMPLGPWHINGFKWFSSATDCNMTILLAKTTQGGLSAFMAPMSRRDATARTATGQADPQGECLNGVRIQRLKEKFGTRPLPTAELVLEDMRGWMIGEEGHGIRQVSTVLTLSRVHTSVAAVGYVGRSLAIARAYARVRTVGAGKGARMRLVETPLHVRTLAKVSAEYRGLMLLTFFTSYVLGLSEHDTPRDSLPQVLASVTPQQRLIVPLLRVLTQLTKAYVCKAAVPLVYSCMECLGGLGYMLNEEQEYLNLARIFRDCCVLPIWEGTTDVLSTDFLRALKGGTAGRDSLEALAEVIAGLGDHPSERHIMASWTAIRQRVEQETLPQLLPDAREILSNVADLLVWALLHIDSKRDDDPVARQVLTQFAESKSSTETTRWRDVGVNEGLERDQAIVYGSDFDSPEAKL